MGEAYVTPAWITENPTERRATEIFVPVVMKVGPVWSHSGDRGGWYAALEAAVYFDMGLEHIWECEHVHESTEDAWRCAEAGAREVTEMMLGQAPSTNADTI